MHLIVGLGNPGTKYKKTRHNVGFMVIDTLARKIPDISREVRTRIRSGVSREGSYPLGDKLTLFKPETYMNRSGNAVAELVRFYKIPLSNLMIVHDDIALPLGKLRIRRRGSSGGHNGVQSVIDALHTSVITRFRIGIGLAPNNQSSETFVLKPFAKEETPIIEQAIEETTDALLYALKHGVEKATNRFSS